MSQSSIHVLHIATELACELHRTTTKTFVALQPCSFLGSEFHADRVTRDRCRSEHEANGCHEPNEPAVCSRSEPDLHTDRIASGLGRSRARRDSDSDPCSHRSHHHGAQNRPKRGLFPNLE